MKTLFLLSSCVLFLTGCMITPSDDYYSSTGYYSSPVYYNYSSSYRNYHTVKPVRQDIHAVRHSSSPKYNQNLNKPNKPSLGKEQYRPIRPENSQQRPTRPQQQSRPQSSKPKDQHQNKRPIKNDTSATRPNEERKVKQSRQ